MTDPLAKMAHLAILSAALAEFEAGTGDAILWMDSTHDELFDSWQVNPRLKNLVHGSGGLLRQRVCYKDKRHQSSLPPFIPSVGISIM